MKKLLALCICSIFAASLSGCSLSDLTDHFLSKEDAPAEQAGDSGPRVYMDELKGKLQDFTGNQLTVKSGENIYVFDVSQATLECEEGMITGDEVSIIYEGQLNDTDTSTVKALKVVDEYHKKAHLKDRTAYGQVQGLTPNTITIRAKSGKIATYPITGTEQYYQNGMKAGTWVYIHFKGKFAENDTENTAVLNASHLKTLSVSDIDPLNVPAPTPTPSADIPEAEKEQQMQAVIENVNLNTIQILVQGSKTVLNLDMSSVPCYFKGGAAPGSHVTISYTGAFNGSTLEGITILGITGQNPETTRESHLSFTVSGEIVGSTANTITILTPDGAAITCNTANAQNSSTGGLLSGSSVKITFNPAVSKYSNIYTCLKIEDA